MFDLTLQGEYEENKYISVLSSMRRNVGAYPDRIALCDGKSKLTFQQLHKAAGRRAWSIRQRCPGKNRCIGIMAEQSADTIVNLLSVLYSGNHYIMIDPQMPLRMQQDICKNASVVLVLTSLDIARLNRLAVDILSTKDVTGDCELYEELRCNDPLFAVATSGTTGIPKIIVKSCGAMALFIVSYLRHFHLSEKDVIGNGTPFYSDASAKDVFTMIYGGIRMVVIPPWFFAMPFPLIGRMNDEGVTMISWVPSAYSVVKQVDILRNQRLSTLRIGVFIGEDIPPDTLRYWMEHVPDAQFYNTYGMSELAGICACAQLSDSSAERFPIGQPLAHCRMICVDENNMPADRGRLMICSDALAMGYREERGLIPLKRVELWQQNGVAGLYYDTGDLCWMKPDGTYMLLGRADFQIKHQGYRIELQGVEAAILRNENVHQAVCLYEDRKLIAVVCLDDDDEKQRKALEQACAEQLPRYMQPAAFWYRKDLPLNRNGKIDRIRLKAEWKGE